MSKWFVLLVCLVVGCTEKPVANSPSKAELIQEYNFEKQQYDDLVKDKEEFIKEMRTQFDKANNEAVQAKFGGNKKKEENLNALMKDILEKEGAMIKKMNAAIDVAKKRMDEASKRVYSKN